MILKLWIVFLFFETPSPFESVSDRHQSSQTFLEFWKSQKPIDLFWSYFTMPVRWFIHAFKRLPNVSQDHSRGFTLALWMLAGGSWANILHPRDNEKRLTSLENKIAKLKPVNQECTASKSQDRLWCVDERARERHWGPDGMKNGIFVRLYHVVLWFCSYSEAEGVIQVPHGCTFGLDFAIWDRFWTCMTLWAVLLWTRYFVSGSLNLQVLFLTIWNESRCVDWQRSTHKNII